MSERRGSPREVERVFVYGTLKPGERNVGVARRAGLLRCWRARLPGFDLFHLTPEGYPAVVRGSGVVHGWVLEVRDLRPLDRLEDVGVVPPLYEREWHPLLGGRRVWVYVYRRPDRLLRRGALLRDDGIWSEAYESKEIPGLRFGVGGRGR